MPPTTHREIHLTSRPDDELTTDHFRLVEAPVPEPGPGQVLVRNRVMNVAAAMRELARADPALPMPSYAVGEPLWAPTIGEVVDARDSELAEGTLIRHHSGWREYAVLGAAQAQPIDTAALPDPSAHLSQGFTAWIGLTRGAEVRKGDVVFVSGAAGGIGSMAAGIARLRGAARVVGSTGSQRKGARLVKECGYDAAILRTAGPIEDQLRAVAPDGIDVMFDAVGGEQLRAGLNLARKHARFAIAGALSGQYGGDASVRIEPYELMNRGISLRGVTNAEHLDAFAEWIRVFGRGLRDGTLTFPHARLRGVEQAPRALVELLGGQHIGTVLVEL